MILNPGSPVPLYYQLAEILIDKIRNGEYPEETKIPSENELSKEFQIGRPTVRQATEMLVRKNMLERKRGSGTYVKKKEEEIDLFSLAGTMNAFQKKGIPLNREILNNIELVDVKNGSANPFKGKSAYFFSRLSSVGEKPFLIENIYLSPELFSGIQQFDFSDQSLSGIIEDHFHMKPNKGKQSFSIVYPDKEMAELLKITVKKPLLLVQRYLDFKLKKNAIYSELYCLTERFIFTQKIGGLLYE